MYRILKEARQGRSWPMDMQARCELEEIIRCGQDFIAFIRNTFGTLAKNLGWWATNSDRESKLMKRVLGEGNQESIWDFSRSVRRWNDRYDMLMKRLCGESR